MKVSFNIGLVKVESHIGFKNNICDNIFFHHNVFSPKLGFKFMIFQL
jgi:hypothetical protein